MKEATEKNRIREIDAEIEVNQEALEACTRELRAAEGSLATMKKENATMSASMAS